jgi:hypothetical protein
VSPGSSAAATFGISLATTPTIQILPGTAGNFQIFWPTAAAGYILQKTTDLMPPVSWINASEQVVSSNGQYAATIVITNSTMFYRLMTP